VRDQGPGIPEAELPKIFDRFFRGSGGGGSRQNGRKPGSGLGLAIAQRIAEAHGARLEAASRPGEGAEFRLRIKKV
jgi:signal transduction histidine kinase